MNIMNINGPSICNIKIPSLVYKNCGNHYTSLTLLCHVKDNYYVQFGSSTPSQINKSLFIL